MATCKNLSRLGFRSTLRQLTNHFGSPSGFRPCPGSIRLKVPPTSQRWIFSGTKPNAGAAWHDLQLSHCSGSRISSITISNRFGMVGYGGIRQKHAMTTAVEIDHDQRSLPSKRRPILYTPPPTPTPDRKHKTLTLYTITPIPEDRLEDLREEIFLQLVKFDITGRIYLAKDGINLHLCAPVEHVNDLQSSLQELVLDRYGKGPDGAIWNFSCEQPGERVFRKLKVAVKRQLVADGRLGSWNVEDSEPPQYLEPEEFHARLDQVGDKALLVDMRNHFENEVGTFKTAVKMDCTTFRQNMDLLDELLEGRDKNKEVMMVCTGGIRCSISGRYLKQKGFTDVKMLKGGITSYGRYIKSNPDIKSHFVGKNFTFDGRRGERITDDVISSCHQCHTPHDDITNCANTRCHLLFIQCPSCRQKWKNTCGPECRHALETGDGPAMSKPYDYHAQVRPGILLPSESIPKAA